MKNREHGILGEALARDFLESMGYRCIDSNFVRRVGEIDLVMRAPASAEADGTLVFVEVRYRSTSHYGGALASIDSKKQRRIVRAANAWLQKYASSQDCARIDVIAIEPATRVSPGGENLWKNHHILWLQNAIESVT